MFIVRYADDFRIYCRTKDTAERTMHAVIQWLRERLKLEISEKKTRIINVRNHYSDFLGFKMKVHRKGNKLVVISYIADKNFDHKRQKLKTQAKRIVHPRKIYGEQGEIRLYNSMVTGMQNYYCIATHINHDCAILNRAVMTLLTNRLSTRNGNRLVKTGRELTEFERSRFGKSKMMRYVAGTNEPVYPIGYTQHKNPLFRKKHGITTLQRGGKAFTITYESIWPFCSRLCGSHPMAIARNMQITEYHYSLLNGENVLLPVKNSQVHMRFTVITNCPGILEAMIPMGILF